MKYPRKAGNQNAKKPNPKSCTLSIRCRPDHREAVIRKAADLNLTLHDLLILPNLKAP